MTVLIIILLLCASLILHWYVSSVYNPIAARTCAGVNIQDTRIKTKTVITSDGQQTVYIVQFKHRGIWWYIKTEEFMNSNGVTFYITKYFKSHAEATRHLHSFCSQQYLFTKA